MARSRPDGDAIALHDPITVIIADDHRSFGEALQIALDKERDLSVVGVVDRGNDAVRTTIHDQPDVVLMDLRMPDLDGIEATRKLREEGSRSAVIILTGEGDDVSLARAIQVGARGFLYKTAPMIDVVEAVRRASRGEPLHRPAEVNRAIKTMRARSKHDTETARDEPTHPADAHPEHLDEAGRPLEDGCRRGRDPIRQGHPSRSCSVGS